MRVSKLKIPKVCEHCGKPFEAKTVITRFCSDACNNASLRKRKKQALEEECKQQIYKLLKMKKIILVTVSTAVLIILQSCSSSPKNEGTVTIKNGKNELVTIPYECTDCEKNSIDEQTFTTIVNEIANSAKNNLRQPLSFVPSNINLTVSINNVMKYYSTKMNVGKVLLVKSTIYYTAKNGFGNELDGKNDDLFYIRNGSVDRELSKQIELSPLVIKDGLYGSTYVDRKFLAINENHEFITISPNIYDGVQLIVKSTLEEGGWLTTLTFSFAYGEKAYGNNLVLESTRDSNEKDKSIAYFNLTKEQINILSNNKISSVNIRNYKKSIYCPTDENQQTYFIEYFKLPEVDKATQ
jgi:hypothetical protein